MLITFKTLQQKIFKIEAQPADTVADLKAKVAADRGDEFPADIQKLIYNGKVLDDAKTLEECGVNETGFVVVMAGKKAQPAATSAASSSKPATATEQPASASQQKPDAPAPAAAAAAAAVSTSASSASATPAQPQPTGTTPAATASASAGGESALVVGADFEKTVSELIGMGFERSDVMSALRAAFNNPERAVEYLLNPESMPRHAAHAPTSPSGAQGTPQAQPQAAAPAAGSAAATPAPSSGSGSAATQPSAGSADPLSAISRTPQFRQMRTVLQSNPDMLPSILEQIGRTNPPLLQLISANQARFLELLNAPELEGGEEFEGEGLDDEESGVEQQAPGAGGRGPGTFIQVTPQEKEAIERLKGLGFPEHLVIQAYFACDKNEDAAANFLLSEQFDEDEFRG